MTARKGGVPDAEIRRANTTDPTPFLESRGLRVVWEGRHGYIFDGDRKAYRITLKDDGRYVSRPNRGDEKLGDNIALARDVDPGLGFQDAVEALLGYKASIPAERREAVRQGAGIVFPPEADRAGGRRYLISARRIEPSVLDAAEAAGTVRYGYGCVAFCGYETFDRLGADRCFLRNVSYRSTGPLTPRDKRTWNLAGSDKAWPAIFPGEPSVVWVVEGGVDGLAVQSLYHRGGRPVPTVIASGGIKVKKFLANSGVATILRAAAAVWLARERERNPEVQAEADKDHEAQRKAVEAVIEGSGAALRIWLPPSGVKDIAELNEARERADPPGADSKKNV